MICLEMPMEYVLEMIADWRGAGMAKNNVDDARSWYLKTGSDMWLNSNTRIHIDEILNVPIGTWFNERI